MGVTVTQYGAPDMRFDSVAAYEAWLTAQDASDEESIPVHLEERPDTEAERADLERMWERVLGGSPTPGAPSPAVVEVEEGEPVEDAAAPYGTVRQTVAPCFCECSRGGFCGGCGHAGCKRR